MARFVVDTSVVMAWCFEDESNAYANSVLGSLATHEAVVPAIWPLEVGNVLLVAGRRGRLNHADAVRFVALLKNLSIVVEQESPERMLTDIIALARDLQLSTYDASYLDLSMRAGLPIATLDKALRKAARTCRVSLFAPGAGSP
jgi:predicted nucleic acid-binding protein